MGLPSSIRPIFDDKEVLQTVIFKSAAVLAALALISACGSNAASPGGPATGTTSTAPASAAGPQRIVSLSSTATETLFAVGAGKQVVAVDKYSNYPASAPKTQLDGLQPNAEAIARYAPDLVVAADDTGNLKAQLAKLKIPVRIEPAAQTLADAYGEIDSLGTLTGHGDQAVKLVASMRQQISGLIKGLPHRSQPLTYFHELDDTLYTATSKTFIGALYSLVGLRNIADATAKSGNQYPQLSAEYLVKADPDLVFLADTKCCAQSQETFGARPGFAHLKAVLDRHVIPLDDDVASRWGPRIVDFLRRIVAVITSIPAQ
jgi:iron complex transport system substrate-binding protein